MIDGVLQLNQDKGLTTSQKSLDMFSQRYSAQGGNHSWRKGCMGAWVQRLGCLDNPGRVREQRAKCCPKKAEDLRAGTSEMSSSSQTRFHVWQIFQNGYIPLVPFIFSKARAVFEKRFETLSPGFPWWDKLSCINLCLYPKMLAKLKIRISNYMVTCSFNEWGSRNKVAWATSVVALLNIRVLG